MIDQRPSDTTDIGQAPSPADIAAADERVGRVDFSRRLGDRRPREERPEGDDAHLRILPPARVEAILAAENAQLDAEADDGLVPPPVPDRDPEAGRGRTGSIDRSLDVDQSVEEVAASIIASMRAIEHNHHRHLEAIEAEATRRYELLLAQAELDAELIRLHGRREAHRIIATARARTGEGHRDVAADSTRLQEIGETFTRFAETIESATAAPSDPDPDPDDVTRRHGPPALLLLIALVVAGCTTTPGDRAGSAAPDPSTLVPSDDLPEPTPGVAVVDGDEARLAALAQRRFRATPAGRRATVTLDASGVDRAFERLCGGEVDLVLSSRPISAAESEVCWGNGLGAAPFQVATDAIVVAVANGTEPVTDCLTLAQVEDAVAGADDAGTLALVAGSATDREQALALPGLEEEWDAAVVDFKAQRSWFRIARGELRFARTERQRGIADDRPPRERASDDARVRGAEAELDRARAARRAAKAELGRLDPLLADARRSVQAVVRSQGTVGRFHAGYVAGAGDLLRPLAVADADGRCVFPTADTIASGDYPLVEPVFATGTTRSLARGAVMAFLRYQLEEADALAERAGLVPLPADELAEQLARLDDGDLPVEATPAPEPERPAQ